MDRLKRLTTWRAKTPEPHAAELFFVRGHPRSGTNWVGSLLNLHPAIHCMGEFHLEQVLDQVRALQRQTWQIASREPLKSTLDECFRDMVQRCVRAQARACETKMHARWLGDRTPRELRPLLPGAHYFLVTRDGRDVLVSWTFHLLKEGPAVVGSVLEERLRSGLSRQAEALRADPNYFRQHPEELLTDEAWVRHVAARWSARIKADLDTAAKMQSGMVPGRVHHVSYEKMHADPEGERNRMYAFLGADPAPAAPISAETRTAAGFGREDAGSFFRKGEVGDWRTYATDSFRAWFGQEAGEALIELGCERDGNW